VETVKHHETIREVLQKIIPETEKSGLGEIRMQLSFPSDFPAFQGHFPDGAILPAVVQVMSAVCILEKGLGEEFQLKEIIKARFKEPVLPEQVNQFLIKTNFQEDKICVSVKISDVNKKEKSRFDLCLVSKK
jgi:3-hydroxymyristoyl/3-hydroxydecanoyl-(acyl carrier protein) dehydratase